MTQITLPLANFICVEALPSTTVEERGRLPKESGIYFVLNATGVVQYIGRTTNLYLRWIGHHRLDQYNAMTGARIAWLTMSNPDLLPAIEQACIEYFQPQDNGRRLRDAVEESPDTIGNRKILGTMRLTKEAWRLLRALAAQAGVSMMAIVEVLIREHAKKQGIQ